MSRINDQLFKDIEYSFKDYTTEMGEDKVIKVEDALNAISELFNKYDVVLTKEQLKTVFDNLIRDNINNFAQSAWEEVERQLGD